MYSLLEEREVDGLILNKEYERAEDAILNYLSKRPGSIGLLGRLLTLLELNCSIRLLDVAEEAITSALTSWFKFGIKDERLLSILSIFNLRLLKIAIENDLHPLKNLKPFKIRPKPKILILTCLWKRLELTKEFLSYYASLKKDLESFLELDLVAVGSEGLLTKNLTEDFGFHYVESPNRPLSDKWQKGLSFSSQIEFDALIILGSDDFLDKNTFFNYIEVLRRGVVFYGFYDAYVYDSGQKDLMHWPGYHDKESKMPHRTGETVGMGRMLHRSVLEMLNFDLWKGINVNSSLDGYAQKKLKKSLRLLPVSTDRINSVASMNGNKIAQVGTTLKDLNLFAVDIKGASNVTDPNAMRKVANLYDYRTSKDILKSNLGSELAQKFDRLTDVKVSIVILAHKESEYLNTAIESALSQEFDYSYEVILASDSAPELEAVAKKYNIKFSLSMKNVNNTSCSKNLNDAVMMANGDYVKLAAYDDFMPNNCIQDLYQSALINDSSLVFGNAYEYYSENKIKKYIPTITDVSIASQVDRNSIHGGTILFHRIHYLLVSGLNENLIYAEEFDFYFKLLIKNYNFSYVNSFVYYYRRHEQQKGTLSLSDKEKEEKADLVSRIGQNYSKANFDKHIIESAESERSCLSELKIVAGMATIESRKRSLIEVINSIYDQVDEINIYQNGYKDLKFLSDPNDKINIVSSLDTGLDKGDAGKFYFVEKYDDSIYFSMDDDLNYPSDYVEKSLDALKRDDIAIYSYHGKVYKTNSKDWFNDILINVRCTDEYTREHDVQFGGTGVMFFRTSDFSPKFCDFKKPNMADVFVGLIALKGHNRIRALPHNEKWITVTSAASEKGIADNTIYKIRRKSEIDTINIDESKYLRDYFELLNPSL